MTSSIRTPGRRSRRGCGCRVPAAPTSSCGPSDPVDRLVVEAESPIATELTVSMGAGEVRTSLQPRKPVTFEVPAGAGVHGRDGHAYLLQAQSSQGFVPHVFDRVSPDYRNLGAQLRFRPISAVRRRSPRHEGAKTRRRIGLFVFSWLKLFCGLIVYTHYTNAKSALGGGGGPAQIDSIVQRHCPRRYDLRVNTSQVQGPPFVGVHEGHGIETEALDELTAAGMRLGRPLRAPQCQSPAACLAERSLR